MVFETLKNQDLMDYIEDLLINNPSITKEDKIFNEWFTLDNKNLSILNDSLLVFETDFIDAYDDEGDHLKGLPLFKIISFEDIEDTESKVVVLDVKIPYKLDINYTHRIEVSGKYSLFYIESNSNLFKSNMAEQNVDNSFASVKELLDGKFNLLRHLNYEEIPFTLSEICSKNSIVGFQSLIYEMMVMALSRSLNDVSKEFRFEAHNKENYKKFQMINVRDISRNTSAFSAIASENISKSLLTALVQSKKEKESQVITPQEQIALGKY